MDIDIDDGKYKIENLTTQKLCVYNGKYGGGGLLLAPNGILNDGLLDISFVKRLISSMAIVDITQQAGAGGFQNYYEKYTLYRGKKVKVTNKSMKKDEEAKEEVENVPPGYRLVP